jgi:hypothetical protein
MKYLEAKVLWIEAQSHTPAHRARAEFSAMKAVLTILARELDFNLDIPEFISKEHIEEYIRNESETARRKNAEVSGQRES